MVDLALGGLAFANVKQYAIAGTPTNPFGDEGHGRDVVASEAVLAVHPDLKPDHVGTSFAPGVRRTPA
jgi:hypothetical protein